MSFTFSTRLIQIMKRSIEFYWNDLESKESISETIIYNDSIDIVITKNESDDDNENNDLNKSIIVRQKTLNNILYSVFWQNQSLDEVLYIIEQKENIVIDLCKFCDSPAKKNNLCKKCYLYHYIRGEDCCICFEDDGMWIKLTECGHYIHNICFKRIGNNKCPLCRCFNSKVDSHPFNQ